MENSISVKVAYALADKQEVITVELPVDSTVNQAIKSSGILQKYKQLDLAKHGIGIYGKIVELDQKLHDQDRVEIYRPLGTDPMQARRNRADLQR